MSNKHTSVYDWLKYIKANVVGINSRELRLISYIYDGLDSHLKKNSHLKKKRNQNLICKQPVTC